MSYATVAELKVWIGIEDTSSDAPLQTVLDAATRLIDHSCKRSFVLQTAATRLFSPRSASVVEVTDLVSVTSIKVDTNGDRTYATTLAPTEYELLPYFDDNAQPSVRFQEVRIWPMSQHAFLPGRLVQIVGNFGYVDTGNVTPADIKQACLILSARLWKRHETPLGVLANDLGTARITREDYDVSALLGPYERSYAWVAV